MEKFQKTVNLNIWKTDSLITNTTAQLVSSFLGISEYDSELVLSVPKELLWEKKYHLSKNILFVTSQQKSRIDVLQKKVEFAINTLPLQQLLFDLTLENKQPYYFNELTQLINKISYKDELNIVIEDNNNPKYIQMLKYLKDKNINYVLFKNKPFVAIDIIKYLNEQGYLNKKYHLMIEQLEKIIKDKNLFNNYCYPKNKTKKFKETINFNFFSGPGGGKSTNARIFGSLLSLNGLKVEVIDEVPKKMVWEDDFEGLSDQLFILSQQHHKLKILQGNNQFTINDSPLLLGHYYGKQTNMSNTYFNFLDDIDKKYKYENIFLERTHKYQEIGRLQTESESLQIDKDLKQILKEKQQPYTIFKTNPFLAFKLLKEYEQKGLYKLTNEMNVLINEIEKFELSNNKNIDMIV